MVTPEDLKVNAEYIKLGDTYVMVPGGPNYNNYANVDLIVEIAVEMHVEAVWAGWGHASENPDLPNRLSENGILFMGPTGKAMWTLGDKIASTIVAQTADVPTVPWSGSELKAEIHGEITVNKDLYDRACVKTAEEGLDIAMKIGFPIMIKASEGGGGKGIRKVEHPSEFSSCFRQVQAEVPLSSVFIMKLVSSAHHVEVQILADQYGNTISLFTRDCSIQRRHQKIIEESPAIVVNKETLQEMETAAVRLAKLVGYINAGTVEFLYDTSGAFYFLELNPRLQVEHPCTEMITNINLVACQIQIAMGIPLQCIKDIRLLYGEFTSCNSPIDWENPRHKPQPIGHVISARITSENPNEGFKPSSGRIDKLVFESSRNVWSYFSISSGGALHEFADSQFGHCFSWGANREEARKNLVIALKELKIQGEIFTTVEYLIHLLQMTSFQSNEIDTAWLDGLIHRKVQCVKVDVVLGVICGAVHLAQRKIATSFQNFKNALERGHLQNSNSLVNIVDADMIHENTKFQVQLSKSGPKSFFLLMNNSYLEVDVEQLSDAGLLITLEGESYITYMREEVSRYCVIINNKTIIFEKENDASVLLAPSAGKLLTYLVEDGDYISAGQPYAEMEVMKMVMTLTTNTSGKVKYVKYPGAVLQPGSIIAYLTIEDTSLVSKPVTYKRQFIKQQSSPPEENITVNKMYNKYYSRLENILKGYYISEPFHELRMKKAVENLIETLNCPQLPLHLLNELLVSSSEIPLEVKKDIKFLLQSYEYNINSVLVRFPTSEIGNVINKYATKMVSLENKNNFLQVTRKIEHLLKRFHSGLYSNKIFVVCNLLRHYYEVELNFNEDSYDKCVATLQEKDVDVTKVTSLIFSHSQIKYKNLLIEMIIDQFSLNKCSFTEELILCINNLASLHKMEHLAISLKARQVLLSNSQPLYYMRYNKIENIFLSAVTSESQFSKYLSNLLTSEATILDCLCSFFFYKDERICKAALELYVHHVYCHCCLLTVKHNTLAKDTNCLYYSFLETSLQMDKTIIMENLDLSSMKYGCIATYKTVTQFHNNLTDLLIHLEKFILNDVKMKLELFFDSADLHTQQHTSHLPPIREPSLDINICIRDDCDTKDDILKRQFDNLCDEHKDLLKKKNISRITFIVHVRDNFPKYFTYKNEDDFSEDYLHRHIEPVLAFQLDICRMNNFHLRYVQTSSPNVHLYIGKAKTDKLKQHINYEDNRIFVHSVIYHMNLNKKEPSIEYLQVEGEQILINVINELAVAFLNPDFGETDCNHIFLNFLTPVALSIDMVQEAIVAMVKKYSEQLWKLRALNVEVKISVKEHSDSDVTNIRLIIENVTGYFTDVFVYKEETNLHDGKVIFKAYGNKKGNLDGLPVTTLYIPKSNIQHKRYLAHRAGTSYVYDIPGTFEQIIKRLWDKYNEERCEEHISIPSKLLTYSELVLDEKSRLDLLDRPPGENNVGMIAWLFTLNTPEYPDGRNIIVIANDITFISGSFSLQEDLVFFKASELARHMKIPRIYISVNSGARIGLAEEVKQFFQVAWEDNNDPEKGFRYLYLSPEDYREWGLSDYVQCELIEDEEELRYKITAIIGKENGIGVENLQAAGMIAGETSRAYKEIVTISMVSCRAIGIGSYLIRLGQRVIQVENSHIILTGNQALNKVLGSDVYMSNYQLGGIQIMYNNGITHQVASHDCDGIYKILKWLSYIPKDRLSPVPIIDSKDPVNREVDYMPTKAPYDPRWMLEGRPHPENPNMWESGFFDKGSWDEIMKPWAQSVVCGRARLGGIPVGVIAVETRTIKCHLPADPTNQHTEAKVVFQAGQVWYPDSSYKTAQVIQDFAKEDLPLIIFSNWRGFSGGMKDMYEQVMKFGSYIVDSLQEYTQPIIIYIPPYGELRGGAWAVIDTSINPRCIEMYADPDSRGGILEPEGIVEIRFRAKDLKKCMHRNDKIITSVTSNLKEHTSTSMKSELEKCILNREKQLMSLYLQIAIYFADLHDVPQRMLEKSAIQATVPWKRSREILFWRLKRLLLQNEAKTALLKFEPDMSYKDTCTTLYQLFINDKDNSDASLWNDNKTVIQWLQILLEKGVSHFLNTSCNSQISSQKSKTCDTMFEDIHTDPEDRKDKSI